MTLVTPDDGNGCCPTCGQPTSLAMLASPEVAKLREALVWYAEQVEGCRKITSDGDAARQALDADGGKRARAALTTDGGDRG